MRLFNVYEGGDSLFEEKVVRLAFQNTFKN